MDNVYHDYDISGQRLPRYSSVIRTNEMYKVDNIGRKPAKWKWQLQYAEPDEYVIVELDYTVSQSLMISVNGKKIKPFMATSTNEEEAKQVLMSHIHECGYHAFFWDYTIIKFVLTGEKDCVVVVE